MIDRIPFAIGKKQFFKSKKNKSKRIPDGNRNLAKYYRVALWAGILVLGLSGGVAFMQSASARSTSNQVKENIVQLQEQIDNPENDDITSQVTTFGLRFLNHYLNVDTTEQSILRERDEALAEFLPQGVLLSNSTTYSRQLLQSVLYQIEETGNGYLATFYIQYKVFPTQDSSESDRSFENCYNSFYRLRRIVAAGQTR